jgi:hypothetical protein
MLLLHKSIKNEETNLQMDFFSANGMENRWRNR